MNYTTAILRFHPTTPVHIVQVNRKRWAITLLRLHYCIVVCDYCDHHGIVERRLKRYRC